MPVTLLALVGLVLPWLCVGRITVVGMTCFDYESKDVDVQRCAGNFFQSDAVKKPVT